MGRPIKITSIEYVGSAGSPKELPTHDLPEVAVSGRSNVGKSSLINALLGRHRMARVSSKPGHTRRLQFFMVNKDFMLADLPGYGYAAASKDIRKTFAPMVDSYLRNRPELKAMIVILDSRREPSKLDLQLLEYIEGFGIRLIGAITKIDKFPKHRRKLRAAEVAGKAGLKPGSWVAFSAVVNLGREELWRAIMREITPPGRSENAD